MQSDSRAGARWDRAAETPGGGGVLMPSWIVCREVCPREREVEGPRAQLPETGWFERSGKSRSSLEGRGSQHLSRPPPGSGLEIHVDPP